MGTNRRRAAHVLGLILLAVALACSDRGLTAPLAAQGRASAPGHTKPPADTSTSTTGGSTASDTTAAVTLAVAGCPASGYTRLVNVSTPTQLASAISGAQPGDQIRLASGTYLNTFTVSRSGTSAAPITLCGAATAVLTKGRLDGGGFALVLNGASWWRLLGFRVTNAQQGIHLLHANHNVVSATVDHVGQEAIHLAAFSSHNEIRASVLHDTGLYLPQYGEGVYVGSAPTQWCQWSGCGPDRSDSNRVVGSVIGPNIASDPLDVKAGAIGTTVDSNAIDAHGSRNLTGNANWTGGLAIINGQRALVRWNHGSGAAYHGFSVQSDGNAASYPATGAVFIGNVLDLSGTSGPGFLVGYHTAAVVYCASNAVLGNHVTSGTFANVACAP